MNERTVYGIQEMLERELDEIAAKGELSNTGLDKIDKITRSLEKMTKLDHGGHSGRDYYEGGYQRSYNNNYNNGGYNNSRNSYDGNSYDSYERSRRSYSGHDSRAQMIQKLEDMMNQEGLTNTDREAIQGALSRLK